MRYAVLLDPKCDLSRFFYLFPIRCSTFRFRLMDAFSSKRKANSLWVAPMEDWA